MGPTGTVDRSVLWCVKGWTGARHRTYGETAVVARHVSSPSVAHAGAGKLVRDRVPELIEAHGHVPEIRVATLEEFLQLRREKLGGGGSGRVPCFGAVGRAGRHPQGRARLGPERGLEAAAVKGLRLECCCAGLFYTPPCLVRELVTVRPRATSRPAFALASPVASRTILPPPTTSGPLSLELTNR